LHDKQIRRRRAVLALLVVISLILLTDYFGESSSSPLHSVQRGIVEVLSPVQDGASTVLSPVRDVAGYFSSTFKAKSQVAQLRKENDQLRNDVSQLAYEGNQNRYYAKLLKLDNDYNLKSYGLETASVTGKNPVLWYQTVTVDKGSDAGVRAEDPVVGPGGLVGDVKTVGSSYSVISLLTSPNFSVTAEIENDAGASNSTGNSGLLQPAVGNPSTLLLNYLPSDAQVSPNDIVVTSGFQDSKQKSVRSLYPAGIPIGTVSSENPQSSVLINQQVNVTPTVDLQHLSVVQILTDPNHG
jgi:rod shape-determining protein MreC